MRETNPVYEDIEKHGELKKFMEEKLEDYNMEPGIIGMDLVLFKDAIEHGNNNNNNENIDVYMYVTTTLMEGYSYNTLYYMYMYILYTHVDDQYHKQFPCTCTHVTCIFCTCNYFNYVIFVSYSVSYNSCNTSTSW